MVARTNTSQKGITGHLSKIKKKWIIGFDPVLGIFGTSLRKKGFVLCLMQSGSRDSAMIGHFNTVFLSEGKAKQAKPVIHKAVSVNLSA